MACWRCVLGGARNVNCDGDEGDGDEAARGRGESTVLTAGLADAVKKNRSLGREEHGFDGHRRRREHLQRLVAALFSRRSMKKAPSAAARDAKTTTE